MMRFGLSREFQACCYFYGTKKSAHSLMGYDVNHQPIFFDHYTFVLDWSAVDRIFD